MRQAVLIFKKEFKDYFISPIAYIVIAIFLIVTGWLFFSSFFLYDQADLRRFFNLLPFLFALVVPIITMRLFSEELNVGSWELLFTLPVTFRDIIVGKFMAALAFVAAILLPTLSYAIFISFVGDLDWGAAIGGYIGAVFLGGAYAAIGLFASALTRSQIVACIVAMVVCVGLAIVDQMLFFFPQFLLDVIAYISADAHFKNIAKGIVDSRDILYFVSIVFLGLYATHLVMEEK
ncbi:MAG: ABC transporter [Desulfobacteraceae bacterium]|nr:MAG: ABC transporter [Desulfobacteraceae bacterium]